MPSATECESEKLQNESFPNFSNFCPEFCSVFFPNFSRNFRASFRWSRRPEKNHQKSPPFFNAKFPGKHGKNIHKILLESRQSNNFEKHPAQKVGDKVRGSVEPRFAAGLPFLAPETLESTAMFRRSQTGTLQTGTLIICEKSLEG